VLELSGPLDGRLDGGSWPRWTRPSAHGSEVQGKPRLPPDLAGRNSREVAPYRVRFGQIRGKAEFIGSSTHHKPHFNHWYLFRDAGKYRDGSDELLGRGRGRRTGAGGPGGLFAEMYERARGDLPDEDPDREFADRGVRLETTFRGAGVMTGDLTPECAAVVAKVLDALSAPGAGRTMTGPGSSGTTTRYRKRCTGWSRPGCSRSGAGQPVKVWAHISLLRNRPGTRTPSNEGTVRGARPPL